MRQPIGRRAAYCSLALILSHGGLAHADGDAENSDEPTATPYRPTVSNPADLPVPGWLEVEAGALSVHSPESTRTDTLPWLAKYAFNENGGVLIGGNAYDRMRTADMHQGGFGDTFVEWKQRMPVREGMAFGLEVGVEAPTAPSALGIGKPAYLVNGIFSSDIGDAHLDLNLGGTRYTRYPVQASPWQSAWAAALSHPLGGAFGAAVELSGTAQRGADHSHQALAAVNYNASHRIVFDVGVAYGLDRAAHDRSLFCGGVFLLGKLH